MNVLIVEDDKLLAEGLKSALERASYKVTHAGDGLVADQQLRAYEFDLVVLDLGLPDMDGLEVLRALRQRRRLHGKTLRPARTAGARARPSATRHCRDTREDRAGTTASRSVSAHRHTQRQTAGAAGARV